jgi:hypothetical protein
MKFATDTLAAVHEQMARIKSQSSGSFSTNYFRQEMVGSQISTAATSRSVLLVNDEHNFFRLYFFTNDPADLASLLADSVYPGTVVTGYLAKNLDPNIAAALEKAGFKPIATYRRMVTYNLPSHQPSPDLEYAAPGDVDPLHQDLFRAFNPYTDHLPTRDRLRDYVANHQVIVNRLDGRIMGAVCFQLQGLLVNYNYIYSFSGGLDFLRLQNNFYAVMQERGIHAGFLWINQERTSLAALYESSGWRFDGLHDFFYLR